MMKQFCHIIRSWWIMLPYFLPITGQIISLGSCPSMPVVKDFNTRAFLGMWYEQEKYPNLFQFGSKCNTAQYSLKADGTISMMNRHESKITGIESGVRGHGRQLFPGKMQVRFPQPWKNDAPYYIIGTDYFHYAVIATCSEFGLLKATTVWILTRDRHPRNVHMTQAYFDMKHAELSVAFLEKIDQKHCAPTKPPFSNLI
ncbi:apolipoprotein D-like [Armigeres subalbatus]|uniref:apolipoprotein D-like n=1 Tax=Armigeres subalbatus TaxID=124917 RepID=UPI002ED5F24B